MSGREITASATIPQGKFLGLAVKNRAFVGGYGSGKTWVGAMRHCMNAWRHPRINQGYFAPSYPQIRDIYYPTIDEVAYTMGLTVDIREGNKEAHLYSSGRYRSTIICRSMQLPASIVGFKIGHALTDEIDTMDPRKARAAWQRIIGRMRYPNAPNSVDVTTSPEGFRFVYDRFVREPGADFALVQASTQDNAANLPDGYIQSMYDNYPPELVAAYVKGQFVNLTAGTVYRGYNREVHRSREIVQDGEPLRIGMDFNVDHMAAVVYVLRGDVWHAAAEFKDIFDTPAMVRSIQARYAGHVIRVYPDATGKSRKSVGASQSDISQLEAAGWAVYANNTNPPVRDRINATNQAFYTKRLLINDDACPEYARCMEQLAYNVNGEPDKKNNLDHLPDAGTYPIIYEMPIVKPAYNIGVRHVR